MFLYLLDDIYCMARHRVVEIRDMYFFSKTKVSFTFYFVLSQNEILLWITSFYLVIVLQSSVQPNNKDQTGQSGEPAKIYTRTSLPTSTCCQINLLYKEIHQEINQSNTSMQKIKYINKYHMKKPVYCLQPAVRGGFGQRGNICNLYNGCIGQVTGCLKSFKF